MFVGHLYLFNFIIYFLAIPVLAFFTKGRTNWKKRWFVLEDAYLHYYEDFDPNANGGHGMPRNKKGVVPIHNAIISTFPHKGDSKQKHCFVMEHDSRRTFYAAAPSEKLMYLWLDALKKASKLEFRIPSCRFASSYVDCYGGFVS